MLVIQPETMRVHRQPPDGAPNVLPGRVRSVTFLGALRRCTVETDGLVWVVDVRPEDPVDPAQEVYVEVPPERLRVVEG